MEIKDHHVLITGANRGIGRAVALRFAEDKAHLHLTVRTKDESLKKEMLKAGAASVEIYELDLSERSNIDSFLKKINKIEIDILFNNAGQLTGGLLEKQDLDETFKMIQINLNALIHLTHAILPGMLKRKKGKIINHSSVSAIMHFPSDSTYSATKAAVLAFTEALRVELKGTGVTTLALVTPGVDTRMFKEIPKIYGATLDVSVLKSIAPKKYAEMIREAVLEDLNILRPGGTTGIGLALAQYVPQVFERIVSTRFKRD